MERPASPPRHEAQTIAAAPDEFFKNLRRSIAGPFAVQNPLLLVAISQHSEEILSGARGDRCI